MKIFIYFFAVAALALTGMPVHADDGTCLNLAAQMQQLKTQLAALQARVHVLEQAPAKAETGSMPSTASVATEAATQIRQQQAALRQGWKRLKTGMSQDEVKGLLGTPPQSFTLSGKLVWYYYYPDVGGGSVMYDTTGHVIGHQAPPFSGFGLY
ncbi:MAG: hypothetical protein ACYC9L_09160 [Sulfuricaulis sp.]